MKCIKCDTDSKYSERSSGSCPKCNAKFAFEPKTGDLFTDPAFAGAIKRVSADDAVRFTATNLYYELARTKRSTTSSKALLVGVGVVVAIVGGIIAASAQSVVVLVIALAIAGALIGFGVVAKPSPTPLIPRRIFDSMLSRWKAAHGMPPKLVQRVAPEARNEPKKSLPRELATYSFDRAVICDQPETVDLLLANNFHFENNCAILAVGHYPQAVFAPVLEMLRRNPKIEVYALHDASTDGHDLARKLATSPEWFKGIGRVTDVGLLVKHAMKMRGLWEERVVTRKAAFPDLTSEQNAWISQYSVELAAIRPEQVIKRLFRAMTQPGEQVAMEDGGMYFVGGSFGGGDAGTSDGGGDSFG